MISSLRISHFKNHKEGEFFLWKNPCIIEGENGSGKTSILESIYLCINAQMLSGVRAQEYVAFWEKGFSAQIFFESGKMGNTSFDLKKNNLTFSLENKIISRKKYREVLQKRAVFFSNFLLNTLYLGPSYRRSFLDTFLLLSFPDFSGIYTQYTQILKNKNKILKAIQKKQASRDELDYWNKTFCDVVEEYYTYRKKIIDFFQDSGKEFQKYLHSQYPLSLQYVYSWEYNCENFSEFLWEKKEEEILAGRSLWWPHVDDFYVSVFDISKRSVKYLSRGENKMLLFWLQMMGVSFLEKQTGAEIIFLLDDIFSELDEKHIKIILDESKKYTSILTTQENHIPVFVRETYQKDILKI